MPQVPPPAVAQLPDPVSVFDVPFAKSGVPLAEAVAPTRYWPVRTANPRGREIGTEILDLDRSNPLKSHPRTPARDKSGVSRIQEELLAECRRITGISLD
jgi:hypothetical protein